MAGSASACGSAPQCEGRRPGFRRPARRRYHRPPHLGAARNERALPGPHRPASGGSLADSHLCGRCDQPGHGPLQGPDLHVRLGRSPTAARIGDSRTIDPRHLPRARGGSRPRGHPTTISEQACLQPCYPRDVIGGRDHRVPGSPRRLHRLRRPACRRASHRLDSRRRRSLRGIPGLSRGGHHRRTTERASPAAQVRLRVHHCGSDAHIEHRACPGGARRCLVGHVGGPPTRDCRCPHRVRLPRIPPTHESFRRPSAVVRLQQVGRWPLSRDRGHRVGSPRASAVGHAVQQGGAGHRRRLAFSATRRVEWGRPLNGATDDR